MLPCPEFSSFCESSFFLGIFELSCFGYPSLRNSHLSFTPYSFHTSSLPYSQCPFAFLFLVSLSRSLISFYFLLDSRPTPSLQHSFSSSLSLPSFFPILQASSSFPILSKLRPAVREYDTEKYEHCLIYFRCGFRLLFLFRTDRLRGASILDPLSCIKEGSGYEKIFFLFLLL